MTTKTFPYAVIWNGEFVSANTPIKVEDEKIPELKEEKKSTKKGVKKNDK